MAAVLHGKVAEFHRGVASYRKRGENDVDGFISHKRWTPAFEEGKGTLLWRLAGFLILLSLIIG